MNQQQNSQYLSSSNYDPRQSQQNNISYSQYTSNSYISPNKQSYTASQPVYQSSQFGNQPDYQQSQYISSSSYQQSPPANVYVSSYSVNQNQPQNDYNNRNVQDVMESVKRSAAVRSSQQQQQVPSNNNDQYKFTSNISSSNYMQGENNLNPSYGVPNKFASQLTQSQPIQNVLSNSYSLNVPQQNVNYLQTPDRSTQIKGSTNVKIYTPNKSPNACKIVFGSSPNKKQIQQEIEQSSIRALTESQANQKSVMDLKSTIQFISATNSSPEKRQTAKSLINTLNGNQ